MYLQTTHYIWQGTDDTSYWNPCRKKDVAALEEGYMRMQEMKNKLAAGDDEQSGTLGAEEGVAQDEHSKHVYHQWQYLCAYN